MEGQKEGSFNHFHLHLSSTTGRVMLHSNVNSLCEAVSIVPMLLQHMYP